MATVPAYPLGSLSGGSSTIQPQAGGVTIGIGTMEPIPGLTTFQVIAVRVTVDIGSAGGGAVGYPIIG